MTNNIVALLPIKANSQRVKGKNFRLIGGQPLYKWILDTLLSISDIDSVVINTDARDMFSKSGLAEDGRVRFRDRKPHLCGDDVSMNLILKDDMADESADIYLMTHATNPLLGAGTIRSAIDTFKSFGTDYDSLFSVNRFQTRFYTKNGNPVNHDPRSLLQTQDLEPWYEENSCLYLFTHASFQKTGARIGERPMLYEIPKMEEVDIDDEEDWLMASALVNTRVDS